MPYRPGEEEGLRNRKWLFAEYAVDSLGNRSKVPGTGVEVDRRTLAEIPNRGLNRIDQRYMLPTSEIISRRSTRALAEMPECLAIREQARMVEVVSKSENRYSVCGPDQENYCACPDFWRLRESYPEEDLLCKHIIIARLKEAERLPDPLDVGVLWIAEQLGVHYKTVQQACRHNICPAHKDKRTWIVTTTDALAFIETYRAKMYDPDFMEWFPGVQRILLDGKVYPE